MSLQQLIDIDSMHAPCTVYQYMHTYFILYSHSIYCASPLVSWHFQFLNSDRVGSGFGFLNLLQDFTDEPLVLTFYEIPSG